MPVIKQVDKIVEEKEMSGGVLQNMDGDILVNAFQQDLILTRRRYGDGSLEFLARSANPAVRDERVIIPRFDPKHTGPKCRHCGEFL